MVLPAAPKTAAIRATAPANATVFVNVSGAVTRSVSAVADPRGTFHVSLDAPIKATAEDRVIKIDRAGSEGSALQGVAFGYLILCGGKWADLSLSPY